MAIANRILKNFAVFIDGRGYAGNAKEIQLPALADVAEDFRAGGMNAPISVTVGQEKMEADITLTSYDPYVLALWGATSSNAYSIPVVARGALESLDGSVEAVEVRMTGKVLSVEPGAWQTGQMPELKLKLNVVAYVYKQGDATLHDIDIPNMRRVVNGVDTLAAQRTALGLGGTTVGI